MENKPTHCHATYIKILNKIIEDGYTLSNDRVTHTGNNRFEFHLMGQNTIMEAIGYIENDEVVIKYKQTGVWMN